MSGWLEKILFKEPSTWQTESSFSAQHSSCLWSLLSFRSGYWASSFFCPASVLIFSSHRATVDTGAMALLTKIRSRSQRRENRASRSPICRGLKARLHRCRPGLACYTSLDIPHLLINGPAIRIPFKPLKKKDRHTVESTVKGGLGDLPSQAWRDTHYFLIIVLINGSAIRNHFKSLKIKDGHTIRSTVKGGLSVEHEPAIKPTDAACPPRIQTPLGGSSQNETSRW
jgi:hypothetical protein